MTWIITANGSEYHLSGHGERRVDINDIAHHLAQINRFNGAASRPYSVAEHSLFVAEIARRAGATPIVQLAALMHDAHEAYTSDQTSPAKQAVDSVCISNGSRCGGAWSTFEQVHSRHVRREIRLTTTFVTHGLQIREWDLIALATERRDLTSFNSTMHKPWAVLRDGQPDAVRAVDWVDLSSDLLESKSWKNWRYAFKERFEQLSMLVNKTFTEAAA